MMLGNIALIGCTKCGARGRDVLTGKSN